MLGLAVLMLGLSGCGGGAAPVQPISQRPPPSRNPARPAQPSLLHRSSPLAPHVLSLPGLDGVIGLGVTDLARLFGPPRLDVWEGDARKLQFTGTACVLDVYLYPVAPGRPPQATYVDARRGDGRDVDRAACVAALQQERGRR